MSVPKFTIDDLRQILRHSAGVDDSVDLDADILDARFEDLGYDSLALLETAARIAREYDVVLDDDLVTAVTTPRSLIELVNAN